MVLSVFPKEKPFFASTSNLFFEKKILQSLKRFHQNDNIEFEKPLKR
ncbi:hypothetical protein P700755_000446 [Psychroflexus torquis ATCC 700755]|uniref:Uncharacterized protein n=1 Tax=Psychroflexus torquis (strain ATCC 700755 / CIP 106069 / ACAM 623) TaxID=313595 RepID=K4IAP3_PSYTT|nr:hypothetical protein P700755_000446 [Psychroflexus torquis ATCC 700755]